MITVTLNDILNNLEIFREISNKAVPVKTAFRIARLIRELDKESSTFDESRRKIIETYGEYDENGALKQDENGNIIIKPEEVNNCNREIIDLLNTTIEINCDKINIADFGEIELTPAQVLGLENFIEE